MKMADKDSFGQTQNDRNRAMAKTPSLVYHGCGCISSVIHGGDIRKCADHKRPFSLTGRPINLNG